FSTRRPWPTGISESLATRMKGISALGYTASGKGRMDLADIVFGAYASRSNLVVPVLTSTRNMIAPRRREGANWLLHRARLAIKPVGAGAAPPQSRGEVSEGGQSAPPRIQAARPPSSVSEVMT